MELRWIDNTFNLPRDELGSRKLGMFFHAIHLTMITLHNIKEF